MVTGLTNIYKKALRKLYQYRLRSHVHKGSVTPHEKLGTHYGGWYVPASILDRGGMCICAGAGEDISFDLELVKRYGCNVYVCDPTPRAIAHFDLLARNTLNGLPTPVNRNAGACYEIEKGNLEKLHFQPFGIWKESTTLKFYSPRNPEHVSHSVVNLQQTDRYFEAECRRLSELMSGLSIKDPILIKLDIEGAEYAVLDSMMEDGISPNILCVEFDEGHNPLDGSYFGRIRTCIKKLQGYGYVVSHIDNWNVTFLHKSCMEHR